jgi:hypothetical protein
MTAPARRSGKTAKCRYSDIFRQAPRRQRKNMALPNNTT